MTTHLQLPAPVFAQAFHPKLPYYALGCIDGTIHLYHHRQGDFTLYLTTQEATACRAIALRGDYMAYGLRDGTVVVSSVVGLVEALRLPTPSADAGGVTAVAWVNDNAFVVGYGNGLIRIYTRTGRQPLKAEIEEFDEAVTDIAIHPDGDKFYAVAGGQLGLFNVAARDHGTRLLAMSDPNDSDFESVTLMDGGRKICCTCADFGVAIFYEGDLGTHKDRLSGLRFPLRSSMRLADSFLLAGGETGQVLVGQLDPNQWIGVFDELRVPVAQEVEAVEGDEEEAEEEDSSPELLSVDSMVCDPEQRVVCLVDNCHPWVLVRSLEKAREMCEGKSIGTKTAYADFMDEL